MKASRRLLTVLVFLLLTLLSGGLALTIPLGSGYDENTHLEYVAFLAIHQRLPDQAVEDIRAAQHPPAYHAMLAGLYSMLRESGRSQPATASDAEPVTLPYERDVTLSLGSRVIDLHAYSAREAARGGADDTGPAIPEETVLQGAYYLLRATGILFLLALAGIVFRSLDRAFPDRRSLAVLAASASLLVPLVPGIFATIGNDQFAALFGAAGFATVLVSTARGRGHDKGPLALCSVLFGIGFLSKLWVLGAFVAAAWLVTFHAALPWRRRLRSLVLLGSGPILIAGWWLVHRTLTAGSPLGSGLQVSRWPGYLRTVAPDAPFGFLAEAAQVLPTYLGKITFSDLTPGNAWLALAAGWPLLLIGSVLACLLVRDALARDRNIVRSFLAGALVQLAALFVFSANYAGAHGRYMLALLLLATAALVAGLPSLTGRRSRGVLAAFTMLMALGGLLLLHTAALPTFWPEHRWAHMPDLVAYVDLGGNHTERHVNAQGGRRVSQTAWHLPTSGGRDRATLSANDPVIVEFTGLDADDFLLLSPRLLPLGPLEINGLRSAVNLSAAGQWLAGPLSIFAGAEWVSVPALRRLPLRFEGARDQDGEFLVEFQSEAPGRLPPLSLALQRGQHVGPDAPLESSADGRLRASVRPPALGVGGLLLLLRAPRRRWWT